MRKIPAHLLWLTQGGYALLRTHSPDGTIGWHSLRVGGISPQPRSVRGFQLRLEKKAECGCTRCEMDHCFETTIILSIVIKRIAGRRRRHRLYVVVSINSVLSRARARQAESSRRMEIGIAAPGRIAIDRILVPPFIVNIEGCLDIKF